MVFTKTCITAGDGDDQFEEPRANGTPCTKVIRSMNAAHVVDNIILMDPPRGISRGTEGGYVR